MPDVNPESDEEPGRPLMALHYAGTGTAFLVGIVAFMWTLVTTIEGGGVTIWGMVAAVVVWFVVVFSGFYILYRAICRVLPGSILGLDRPQPLGYGRWVDFVREAVRGEPEGVAGYLDDLRGVEAPDVRSWQPGADVPSEVGQAAYRDAQELKESVQRRFNVRVGLAAAAVGLGLVSMWFLDRPIERVVGGMWTAVVFVAVVVGPPFAIVLSVLPGIVRDWTRWYRDHVVEV